MTADSSGQSRTDPVQPILENKFHEAASVFTPESLLREARRQKALPGASYHYLPPAHYSVLHPDLRTLIHSAWDHTRLPLHSGASWTTDAPFRETEAAISACRAEGIVAVEMEAAALYALAQAKRYDIVCFAHVTNQMAQQGDVFEKGPDQGSRAALDLIAQVAHAWQYRRANTT